MLIILNKHPLSLLCNGVQICFQNEKQNEKQKENKKRTKTNVKPIAFCFLIHRSSKWEEAIELYPRYLPKTTNPELEVDLLVFVSY